MAGPNRENEAAGGESDLREHEHAPRQAPEEQGTNEEPQTPAVVTVTTKLDWYWLLWFGGILAFVSMVVWVLTQVPAVSVPLLLAMGIAYVLHPVVDWMGRRGIGRTWAIVLLVSSFVTVLVVLGLLFVPVLVGQMKKLPQQLNARFEELKPWFENTLNVYLPESTGETIQFFADDLSGIHTKLEEVLGQTPTLGEMISSGTSSVLTLLVGMVLVPVLSSYFLRHYPRIRRWIEDAVPRHYHDRFVAHMTAIDEALGGFIRGQGIVALILFVLYAIGFYLVGLPLALLVAVISGLGNYVPYLGTAFGIVLASVILLLDGKGWVDAILVYAVFAVVQFVEGWFITPRVVGDRVGLPPVVVIFFVLLFGELFGFIGVLIAVPVTAVLKILFESAFQRYKKSILFTRE